MIEEPLPDVDGALPRGGPAVLVVETGELLDERMCDFDADGVGNNAIADLGPALSGMLTMTLNTVIAGLNETARRSILHFPWIDDLRGPDSEEAQAFFYRGTDVDHPEDPRDDFSGEEPFFAAASYLDACGEIKHVIEGLRIDSGEVTGAGGTLFFPIGERFVELRDLQLTGSLAPGGSSGETRICGFGLAASLGSEAGMLGEGELTLLEELLAGGAAFGVPGVPGLTPDVDVDGDGLERFELDEDGCIVACVDGDLSVIDGRDCWSDPKIADGFSFTVRLQGVSARFAGREPGWEYHVGPSSQCPEGPPAESAFGALREGSCVETWERCDPWLQEPCCQPADHCSGANGDAYRCAPPCTPSRCEYGELVAYCNRSRRCVPVNHTPEEADCSPGEEGCTTELGVSTSTICFEAYSRTVCVETCDDPTEPCGDDGLCKPLAAESGGVCVRQEVDLLP